MDVADHWQECSSHRVVALGVTQFAAQPEAPVRDALHSQHAGLKKYNSGVFSYSELQLHPRQDMSLRFTGESVATRKVLGQLGKLPGQCSLISGPGPEMEAPLSDVRQAP